MGSNPSLSFFVSTSKIKMMKSFLLLFIATVLISRSTGIPLPDADPQGNIFGNNFHGGVTGACTSNPSPNAPPQVIHGQIKNDFNSGVNTVQQCGATGSCGKKKRSITDETEAFHEEALEAELLE